MSDAHGWDTSTGIDVEELDFASLPDTVREFYGQIVRWGRSAPTTVRDAYVRSVQAGDVRATMAAGRSLNGWAVERQGACRLGLFAATPVVVHFACNQLMRTGKLFPTLGEISDDETRTRSFSNGIPLELPEDLSLLEACTVLPGASRPRSDARAAAASALTELACAFAMFHEVAHVVAGHARFMANRSSLGLLELNERGSPPIPESLRRVWEYEADKIAAVMLLSFVVDPANRSYLAYVFQLSESANAASFAALGLMASTVLFLLFGQKYGRLNHLREHPHPLVRSTYVDNAVRVCAIEDLSIQPSQFDAICDPAMESVFGAWSAIGAPVPALSGWSLIPSSWSVQRQITRLEHLHRRLQPRYREFSWIPEDAWRERG